MEKRYELLERVLIELQETGVLKKLVLVGSWCQYYYRILFNNAPEIPLLRTTDIDFLIPNPPKVDKKVDVSRLLNNIGFDNDFDYYTGLVKYVHPDLEIQFLTPAIGRKKAALYEIKNLNVNAEGLSYLNLLQQFTFMMHHRGIEIYLPEPEAFVLHKIIISQKRKKQSKGERDLQSAKNIGELCIEDERRGMRLKEIYDGMPKKWRKEVLKILEETAPKIKDYLDA